MREIIPVPAGEDFVKQFQRDEQLAEEDAKGISKDSRTDDPDDEPNEFGIILKEKEWFKQTNDQYVLNVISVVLRILISQEHSR